MTPHNVVYIMNHVESLAELCRLPLARLKQLAGDSNGERLHAFLNATAPSSLSIPQFTFDGSGGGTNAGSNGGSGSNGVSSSNGGNSSGNGASSSKNGASSSKNGASSSKNGASGSSSHGGIGGK